MEFISFIVVRNGEEVSSFVTIRVLVVEASSSMEGLVNISKIMDE
jgi:hypothetical protein